MGQRRQILGLAVLALVGVAAMAVGTGCGTAEAKPIEVTYFYLPG